VWDAVDRASGAGIRLSLCSGRPAFGIAREYARRVAAGGWHAFQNGASVVNLGSGESHSAPLPEECVVAAIALARSTGHVLELYGDTRYVTESTSALARDHADLLGVPFEPRAFESLGEPVVRAQWVVSEEVAKGLLQPPHPDTEVAKSTSPVMPDARFVGITRRGVNKGFATRTIAEAYRVALANVMYVGDSGNDLPALHIVGSPIAMGNAEPAVRSAAAHAVGDVDAAGLTEALQLAIRSASR